MRILAAVLCLQLLYLSSSCYGEDKTTAAVVEVVGFGECTDCLKTNVDPNNAFEGLRVTIDCKTADGKIKRRGVGAMDKQGKFTVSLNHGMVQDDDKLKDECYAQLHSATADPCPVETSKVVFKSKEPGKHNFGLAGKLRFSPATCESAFLWHWHKKAPLPKLPLPPIPKFKKPPLFKKPILPPTPVYKKPPVSKPPVPKPPKKELPPSVPKVKKPHPPIPVKKPPPPKKELPPVPKLKKPCPPLVPKFKKPLPTIPKFKFPHLPPVPIYKKPLPPIPFIKPLPPIPIFKKPPCPPLPKIHTLPKVAPYPHP